MKMRRNVAGTVCVEMLESRQLLSATVSQSGSTLAITGDARNQIVKIQDSYSAGIKQALVWLDANGNGRFTDRGDVNGKAYVGVDTFNIKLGGGNDQLTIGLPDGYDGATRTFNVDMGSGSNKVSFSNIIGNAIRNSNVTLNVASGSGADTVNLNLAELSSSTLNASINEGAGNDTLNINSGGRVANSTVAINADLGSGNDRMSQTVDWDNFDLLGTSSVWRTSVAGGAGDDTLNVQGDLGNPAARVQGLMELDLLGQDGKNTISANLGQYVLEGGTVRVNQDGPNATSVNANAAVARKGA